MTSSRNGGQEEARGRIDNALVALADACISESRPLRRLFDTPDVPTIRQTLAALAEQREARRRTDALYWELAALAIAAGATTTSIVEATGSSARTVNRRAVARMPVEESA